MMFVGVCESFLNAQEEREGSMYVRVTTIQVQPDKVDEAIRIFQESVVPAAKQQAGFHSSTLLVDRATGKAIALTHWASEADLKANEASGFYQEQVAKFGPLMTAPPVREAYEVA
jgi:quinol monooxygenase YgiN